MAANMKVNTRRLGEDIAALSSAQVMAIKAEQIAAMNTAQVEAIIQAYASF